ncbi:PLP-dependent aminotransferase family protein [Erwinia persicina]|uniref:PLP-dependent aminotransferase family protein n=1 Tax=Erwinia persicina TaxID=55211 RepID=A0A4U3FPD1_9GAMM|nr:PLP-dependent aminotransferase family protein [Erwinia persicina]MBD8105121.1 PLP-dependent aminotransferase family protein [Erwinia persicina]MBD8169450.1 PLP-dependent aminotransferase family protein [Erwinia persicina]MBD8208267.1 PLP-dependent aminotransferase family protein [Erwinia persicina]MCQ4104189.1 PLP-dependent aminotransferase family protein [Erwinia persicina]TKJ95172.1 PLP-dependent aminotransferase family protein [Erwinia persicina]
MTTRYADRMEGVKPSAIRQLLQFGADPTIISFGGGYPDSSLFPARELQAIFGELLAGPGEVSLQYTHSTGMPKLRQQIAQRMAADGIVCEEDQVLILQGSQQGLDLAARLLINPGDLIATEAPTFLGALIAFNTCQPGYLAIPMDEQGLMTDVLEQKLKEGQRIKLLYTVPDFHNPTGITLSLARRQHLIQLANQYDFIILEDSPYREVRYQGDKVPTLKSMDTQGRVIYFGSFSKILAPGLRLGWSVASAEITEKLGLLKLAADTQCSTLNMAAVSMYLERHNIDDHIQTIKAQYLRKKETMLSVVRSEFPQGISWTDPDGGLFTWMEFPEGFDTAKFMLEHAVPEAKVVWVPGATFFPTVQRDNFARFSYSTHGDEKIIRGMTALAELLKKHL